MKMTDSDSLGVFVFHNPLINGDVIDDSGKIVAYQNVSVIARSEKHARAIYKWKLPNDEYILANVYKLNTDWQVPLGQFFQDHLYSNE